MAARFDPLSYPILFAAPRNFSGLSAWVEHIPFAYLLTQLCRPRTFVELGTHCGDSYLAFCQAVAELNLPTRLFAVDTWAGDKHSGPYGPEVLQWLRANHDDLYAPFSTLLQMDFDTARGHFADGQVDLLHIDGLHTYDAVRHDFDTWLPKMSRRGVVILHDTQVRETDFAVWRVWSEISQGRPNFEFDHGYGLGVLAVGEDPPTELIDFIAFANANPTIIRQLFSALGQRMEGARRLFAITGTLLRQSAILQPLAQERGMRWQFPTQFEPAYTHVVPFAEALTGVIDSLAKENRELRRMMIGGTGHQIP